MSKRKPLSAEEKSSKLLELFHETNDVYQLKDLERIAPKEKGIVVQSIKPVLEELVNSGQVKAKKISGSLYYWSFASDILRQTEEELQQSEQLIEQLQKQIDKYRQQLEESAKSSQDIDEVAAVEREIAELKQEEEALKKQVKELNIDNIEVIKQKNSDSKKILEAANRWTDNIFAIKMFCKTKFNKEDRDLDKCFGIPDDLDYLES